MTAWHVLLLHAHPDGAGGYGAQKLQELQELQVHPLARTWGEGQASASSPHLPLPDSLELRNTGGATKRTSHTSKTSQTSKTSKTPGTSETSVTSPPARHSSPPPPPDPEVRGDTLGLLTVSEGVRDIMERLKVAEILRHTFSKVEKFSL
jgi:hypothetical protein